MGRTVKVGIAAAVLAGIIVATGWLLDDREPVTPWMRLYRLFNPDIPHVVQPAYTESLQMKIDGPYWHYVKAPAGSGEHGS